MTGLRPLMFCSAKHPPQQDLIIESVQEQGSKTSVSSGHGTGKSDMTSIMIMLFIIMYPGARAIIVANKIQQVMTGIFKYIKINWATATSRFHGLLIILF